MSSEFQPALARQSSTQLSRSLSLSAEGKLIGKFNRSPIVFDEACDLSATVQIFFSRMFSKLWGDGNRIWKGSYRKLAQLCRVSVGMAHAALEALIDAGLLVCEALGKNHGDAPTLTIKLSLDRLWKLNERYSKLTEAQREEFCQRYAWKTLKKLEKDLSKFERSHSENEQYRSNFEQPQAQCHSENEQYRSNFERQNALDDAPQADESVPTDVVTDIQMYADVEAPQKTTTTTSVSYEQGYGGTIRIPILTEEGQAFYDLYCSHMHIKRRPNVTQRSAEDFNILGEIKTPERLQKLATIARNQLPEGAKNPMIYPGNLVNALPVLLQEEEAEARKEEERRQREASPTGTIPTSLMEHARLHKEKYLSGGMA